MIYNLYNQLFSLVMIIEDCYLAHFEYFIMKTLNFLWLIIPHQYLLFILSFLILNNLLQLIIHLFFYLFFLINDVSV